jgi:hypothetical protein
MTAVAPGPCASARLLGIVHAVIADAVSNAYGSNYTPQFNRERPETGRGNPALFAGGAAWSFLTFVYNKEPYEGELARSKSDFMSFFAGSGTEGINMETWDKEAAFGTAEAFRQHWNSEDILNRTVRNQQMREPFCRLRQNWGNRLSLMQAVSAVRSVYAERENSLRMAPNFGRRPTDSAH